MNVKFDPVGLDVEKDGGGRTPEPMGVWLRPPDVVVLPGEGQVYMVDALHSVSLNSR